MKAYTVEQIAATFGLTETARGRRWNGPCPLCGGEDRFYLSHGRGGESTFGCNQCMSGDLDPDKAKFREVISLLDADHGKEPYVPHECTRLCQDYELTPDQHHPDAVLRIQQGQAFPKSLRVHRRKPGESGKGKTWTYPSLGFRPNTFAFVHEIPDGDHNETVATLAEGTKAAHAIVDAKVPAVSWNGGADGAKTTDFSRLKRFESLVIWYDADKSGVKSVRLLRPKLDATSAKVIKVVDVGLIPGVDPDKLPSKKGKDAADVDPDQRRVIIEAALAGDTPFPDPLPNPNTTSAIAESTEQLNPSALLADPEPGSGLQFEPDHTGLWAAFRYLRLDLRQNLRDLSIEVAREDWQSSTAKEWYTAFGFRPPKDGWVPLTDGLQARLITHIAEVFQNPRGGRLQFKDVDFRRAVLSLAVTRGVNPVEQWLSALPRWDGKDRLSTMLVDALGVEDCDLYRAISRAFFISAVARVFHPGCKVDLWPYLVSSSQGKGKSTFCRLVLPPDRQEGDNTWFSDSLDLNDSSQKRREQIGNAWIVEYSELPGLNPRRTESTKKWISQQEDRYRPPWYKAPVSLSRSFVVIATGNDTGTGVLPSDASGDRRFVVVMVPDETRPVRVRRYMETNRTQLWAEAVAAFQAGEEWWFPESLEIEQAKRNSRWQRANEVVADKVHLLTEAMVGLEAEPLGDLMVRASVVKAIEDVPKERALQLEFTEQLRKAGWGRRVRRNANGRSRKVWQPPFREREVAYCLATLHDGAPCAQPLDADGRCKVRDTHGGPPDGPPAPGVTGTDAREGQQTLGGSFEGRYHPLTAEIERRLTQLASYDAELRTTPLSEATVWDLDQIAAYRMGLQGFQAAAPTASLNPGHIATLGGAEALMNVLQLSLEGVPAKTVKDSPPDWKGIVSDMHALAVERQQDARQQVSRQLLPRLLSRTLPRLRGI